MRNKKKPKSQKTPEQEALEKHVDAMMDPKKPDTSTADVPEPAITAVAVPATEGPTTAPQLSTKLRKQIAVSHTSAQPLSIDKLDELTEQITQSDSPKKSKKSAEKSEETEESTTADPEDPTEQSTELDDSRTDEAVDDIVAYEGDVMLAVTDATAEERNRQFAEEEPKGHPVFSMLVWTLVAVVAILIVALCALLFMGDNLADKLGL